VPTRPEITPISGEVNHWNILLFADSGAGKTVFAGSDNKVLFLATEDAGRNSGTISAARMGSNANKIAVHGWEEVKNTYEWYEDHPEELKDVNVLAIDSLPEMQRLAKEYVLKVTAPEKIRKQQDPEKMQLSDYGIMHDLVENMVRGFNDLPVNVLYTATPKKVEDADKIEFMVPDIQGKGDYGMAMKIVALMTCYGFMRVETHDVPAPTDENPKATKAVRRRVFYWEDTGTIRGKDRTCSLAPFTINMTLQQMRLAIDGKMIRNSEGKIVKKNSEVPAKKAAPAAPKVTAVQASPQATDKVELSTPADPGGSHKSGEDLKSMPAQDEKGDSRDENLELDAVQA
jgi:hypothetical protein